MRRLFSFQDKLTTRQLVGLTLLGLLFVLAAAVVIWREDILRTALDPKVPFQTYDPPPAPDYSQPSAWALAPADAPPPGQAAIFFIHPTTFDGGGHWNGPIDDDEANAFLRRAMLPNYAGPFYRVGAIYAPRYRQASLYAQLTLREDAREARIFAYGDVRRAFEAFLERVGDERPLILAGVGQGADLLDHLLMDMAADPRLTGRIVAAYMVDAAVPAARYAPGDPLPACENRDQAGCVVAWLQVREGAEELARRRLERALVWTPAGRLDYLGDRTALCVNPILGARTDSAAPARLNLGAANATGLEWGARPAFLSRQVGAQCRDGVLRYSQPESRTTFRDEGTWADQRKSPQYNLFYADIEADAEARLAVWHRLETAA
ncbi:DUF3089 domain-containing protein [Brevundimonas sp. 2R-24]|uniref:DUF3089 domain-containing protein n=1 Tax=Peiella sedimenti TaxID=3061083 RepID=A0ABT8SJ89_9CAUL|nr:DUF3089 domain-containing protein [Caulobacteraceae bacterium XZ-24]